MTMIPRPSGWRLTELVDMRPDFLAVQLADDLEPFLAMRR